MTQEHVPGSCWSVYRDGGLWSVQAPTLVHALDAAVWCKSMLDGRLYLPSGVTMQPDTPPPTSNGQLDLLGIEMAEQGPIALLDDGRRLWMFDAHTVSIDEVERSLGAAIEILVRAEQRLADARARQQVETQRGKDGHPVAVQWFKSGKRAGQIKWPAKTNALQRAAIEAAIVSNVQLELEVDAATTLVDWTAAVVESLTPPRPLADLNEQELHERRSQVVDVIAAAGKPTPEELTSQLRRIDRRLDSITSPREHGFDVGSIAWLLPAKWDDIQRPRRVRVLKIDVQRDVTYGGTHVPIEHRRLVQVIDEADRQPHESQGMTYTPVERLTAVDLHPVQQRLR